MKKRSTVWVSACLASMAMALAVVAANAMTPRTHLSAQRPPVNFEDMIPKEFDGWQIDKLAPAPINPVQDEALSRIYTQVLSRTYVHRSGSRIMLAVTYGPDQRADRAVHYPEVCYPAQGFQVTTNRVNTMQLGDRTLGIRQLETNYNNNRLEPVTYWTTIGDFSSLGGFRKRLIELRYGLNGIVPDGILFRVSSVGPDSPAEFAKQARFIQSLMHAVRPDHRVVLTGKPEH